MNALMKQAQQMQAEMMEAQEKLKDEVVEASAGGGMVKVKMSGDLRLREIAIDPEAIDPEDAEMLQDMVLAAVNEALRAAQELASSKMGGIAGGGGLGRLGSAGHVSAARGASVSRRVRRRSSAWSPSSRGCRGSASAPPSGSPSTSCALRRGGVRRSADAIREVKEKVGLCEDCFNLAEGPLCRICADAEPRPVDDLRGRGARRRDPDRAHPRVPRPLPRARRRALADRRRSTPRT